MAISGRLGCRNRKLRTHLLHPTHEAERTNWKGMEFLKPLKPVSGDMLPPTRPHILYLLQIAPSAVDQVFKKLSPWRTFSFKPPQGWILEST